MLREQGSSVFTEDLLWWYHAYDYGWRRVYRDDRNEVSPIDPDGKRFNSYMVGHAERFFRARRDSAREYRERIRSEEMVREGRELIDAWAQAKGYADVDAYAAARGIHWSEAYKEYAYETEHGRRPKRVWGFKTPASALGVTAREYTPEEMAAGRRQIGIEDAAP